MSQRPLPSQPLVDRLDALVSPYGIRGVCRACGGDPLVHASVVAARDRGNSWSAIAKTIGCHRDSVSKCIESCP